MTSLADLMSMKSRKVLITGAAGFLGRTMANTMAEIGAELILVDLPGSNFELIERQLLDCWQTTPLILECNLEIESDRLELIASVNSLADGFNCLINNAAFVGSADLQGWAVPFEHQSLDTWKRALEVNLTAIFHLSQAFTPILRNAKGGNIINIGSIYGEFGPDWRLYENTNMGNPAAYGASKGGLIQFTRWLATTVAPDVRVNIVSPGGLFRDQSEEFVQKYKDRTPLGRMATEEDFQGAIAYLASDLSRYVTGQNLRIDGGWGSW